MQKFLLLRILSALSLITVAVIMIMVAYNFSYYAQTGKIIMFFITQLMLALLINQSALTFYLYQKYYPEGDLQKSVLVYCRISAVLSWICISFLALGVLGLFIQIAGRSNPVTMISVLVGTILVVIYVMQLNGTKRLIKTIQQSYSLQIEESFT